MLSAKLILTALAFAAVSSAAPSSTAKPSPDVLGTITLCNNDSPPDDCVTLSNVVDNICVSLTGNLDHYNKAVSFVSLAIPDNYACGFMETFDCTFGGGVGNDVLGLGPGNYFLFEVAGEQGGNFNDKASSFLCGPTS
ncbi:hypothetical protein MVEN_00706100 [Mycena venus]|uniref:Uncharacterized protein n=1 Tax=Mycena venus TaxID=2733690 RepID=A0A8H6YK87_9AGAR|nr:hypothetical protein MVEN_00706100 [Mycena venus]